MIERDRFSTPRGFAASAPSDVRNVPSIPQAMQAEILDRRVASQNAYLSEPNIFSQRAHVIRREVV
jgi:hypothetical protein